MKAWIKRMICISLGVCLLLSGCATRSQNADETPGPEGSSEDAPRGRYLEQTYDLPFGDIPLIMVQDDGSLRHYDLVEGHVVCYTSLDGQTWEESDDGLASALTAYGESHQGLTSLESISYGPNGEAYVLYREHTLFHLIKSTDGETFEEIVINGWDQDGSDGTPVFPIRVRALGDGDFLVGYVDMIVRYGPDGSEKTRYDGMGNSFAVSEDQIMCLSMREDSLLISDLENGAIINTVPLPYTTSKFLFDTDIKNLMAVDETGALYMVDENGIHRLAPGGSLWETVVVGDLTSLGIPTTTICSLMLDGGGGYYAVLRQDTSFSLAHYTFSADISSLPGGTLSIYALRDNATVRQAIGEFQKMHPDYQVDFRYGLSGDESVSVSDLVRTLNTELLAGAGPDVLLLDGLPADSYIEKGVLLDMGGVLNPMIESGAILPNIAAPYVQDGKIYTMPIRFAVPIMLGSEEIINSIDSLKALADAIEESGDANFLTNTTNKGRIAEFYLTSHPAWINTDGAIQEQSLTDFLADIKRIGDVIGDHDYVPEGVTIYSTNGVVIDSPDELGHMDDGIESLLGYVQGDNKLCMEMLTGFADTAHSASGKDQAGGQIVPLCGQGADVFTPYGIVGVNSASRDQALALELVEILLGADVQTVDLSDGFPVNANALAQGIMTQKERSSDIDGFSVEWSSEENLKQIGDMIKTLDTPSTVDTALLEMIQDGSEAFFAGEETAAQAAATIAERAQAFLTE